MLGRILRHCARLWGAVFCMVIAVPAIAEPSLGWQPTDCPFAVSDSTQVTCGQVTVVQDPADSSSKPLRLAVARVNSLMGSATEEPLLFVTGGPGFGAVRLANSALVHPMWRKLRQNRDLILVDFRGVGFSEPEFCPEENRVITAALNQQVDEAALLQAVSNQLKLCAQRFESQGGDLAQYSSATIAADLKQVREAMGYQSWHVMGLSYGARIVATLLKQDAQGVRSAALISPTTLNESPFYVGRTFSQALDAVFAACESDPECRDTHSSLRQNFYRLLSEYEQNPMRVDLRDESRFPGGFIRLDGTLLASSFYQAMFKREFLEVLPLAVESLLEKDERVISSLASNVGVGANAFSWPLNYAVTCFDGGPYLQNEQIDRDRQQHPELASWYQRPDWRHACAAFHPHRANNETVLPVETETPVLAMAGSMDPATPVAFARRATERMANAQVVEVPHHSHHFLLSDRAGCAVDLLASFFDSPMQPLNTECLSHIPELRFAQASDYKAVGIAASQIMSSWLLKIGMALALLALLLGFLVNTALLLRSRTESAVTQAVIVVGLSNALGWLVSVAMLTWAALQTMQINTMILAFGLAQPFAWVSLLPWIASLLSGAHLVCLLMKSRTLKGRSKALQWVLLASSLALTGMFVLWGSF